MNIQKLEALATRLENWDDKTYGRSFDMSRWIYKYAYNCKTYCGIAGDVVLNAGLHTYGMTYIGVYDTAKAELDLSEKEANWLFGGFTLQPFDRVSPQTAAKAVRLLISEGSDAVGQVVS